MNKSVKSYEKLIHDLRVWQKAFVTTGDLSTGQVFADIADSIEELIRKDKFYAFIWETLGHDRMKTLIDMYREEQEREMFGGEEECDD